MKVGIVCPYDWDTPGGVKTHIFGLSTSLNKRGIETEILAPSDSEHGDIYRLGSTFSVPANGSISRICFSNKARARIRQRMSRNDIDLLHLHEPLIPSTSMLALRAAEVPTVATFHASRPRSFGYALAKPLLSGMASRLEERIVVSRAAQALVERYFQGEYRVIPNGVEFERLSLGKPKEILVSLKPFVLFLGRAESRKGYPVLVDAMKILRAEQDVRLVVAGPTRPDFLPPWGHYLGEVSEEDKPNIYASADVYCAPSLGGESFGVVLIEAMAAGAPVVCSDIDSYKEAAGGAAIHFTASNPVDLAEKLRLILRDRSLQSELREKGRDRARQFDWDLLSQRVGEVYEAALS